MRWQISAETERDRDTHTHTYTHRLTELVFTPHLYFCCETGHLLLINVSMMDMNTITFDRGMSMNSKREK